MRMLLAVAVACGIPAGVSGARQLEQPSPLDSARIHSRAVDAQGRFERIRVGLLPYVRDGGRHPCDELIGRLCIWHEGEDEWEPIPDPVDLVEARQDLLSILAEAAVRRKMRSQKRVVTP